ncbi:hypothetical protein OAO01_03265 [Oligoflexia bacterium]|nr:hypothetical protein [Oligoflexia bacterium]
MKRILFFMPFGCFRVHTQLDMVVATALRLRGCEVFCVGCDGIYRDCEPVARSENSAEDCRLCGLTGKEFCNTFQLPLLQLREYITEDDYNTATAWADAFEPHQYSSAKYEGLPIGLWSTSSIYSLFCISNIENATPRIQEAHRHHMIDSFVTYKALVNIVDKFSPTNFVVFNGRFAPYRVASEVAKFSGIPLVSHERGTIDDCFYLYANATSVDAAPIIKYSRIWKHNPLATNELEDVKQYLAGRESGTEGNLPSFYDYKTDFATVRSKLNIPQDVPVLALFTSSEYELACVEGLQNVTAQTEIVDHLLEIFKGREEYLVIRHHPYLAGSVKHGSQPDYGFLTKAHRQTRSLPPNVRIVMPSEQLNSYALLRNINACIAPFSTVGLEAVAHGVPTAASSESFYREVYHVLYTDFSKNNIADVVDQLFKRSIAFGVEDLRSMYRFLDMYNTKINVKFKSFGFKNHYQADFRFASIDELLPGSDPTLDRVCDHIIDGTELIKLPEAESYVRTTTAEDVFFENELKLIEAERAKVAKASAAFHASYTHPCVGVLNIACGEHPAATYGGIASLSKGRYALGKTYTCQLTPDLDCLAVSKSLLEAVNHTHEPYIAMSHAAIEYNESYLSSAIGILADPTTQTCGGVAYGTYLLNSTATLIGEAFTSLFPVTGYAECQPVLAELPFPHLLLAFAVFRKEALQQVIAKITSLSDPRAVAEAIINIYNTDLIRTMPTAMTVLTPNSQ